MRRPFAVMGTYGRSETRSLIYGYPQRDGSTWYAVDGSVNVNCTYDDVSEGVDVETLNDHDTFTAGASICSEDDLEREVDE